MKSPDDRVTYAGGAPWIMPVLLAIAGSAAVLFGYLYFSRPVDGEIGVIQVTVSEEPSAAANRPVLQGKRGTALHIVIGEGPLPQNDKISPRGNYTGVVYYPIPYALPPHVKLSSAGRQYDLVKQDETGFTWVAKPLLEDLKENSRKDAEALLRLPPEFLSQNGHLKPNLRYDDFTWEARGIRADLALIRNKHSEERSFHNFPGPEREVYFRIPFASPPHIEFSGVSSPCVIITQYTSKSFKWKHVPRNGFVNDGVVKWVATGIGTKDVPKAHPQP